MTNVRKVKKLKKKNCLLAVLLLISTTAFVYSAINLIDWQKDNKITNDNINDINSDATITTSTEGEAVNSENEPKDSIYWTYIKTDLINVDFTELKKKNKDTKGWIHSRNKTWYRNNKIRIKSIIKNYIHGSNIYSNNRCNTNYI